MSKKQRVLNVCKRTLTQARIEVEAIGKTAENSLESFVKGPRKVKIVSGKVGYKK